MKENTKINVGSPKEKVAYFRFGILFKVKNFGQDSVALVKEYQVLAGPIGFKSHAVERKIYELVCQVIDFSDKVWFDCEGDFVNKDYAKNVILEGISEERRYRAAL